MGDEIVGFDTIAAPDPKITALREAAVRYLGDAFRNETFDITKTDTSVFEIQSFIIRGGNFEIGKPVPFGTIAEQASCETIGTSEWAAAHSKQVELVKLAAYVLGAVNDMEAAPALRKLLGFEAGVLDSPYGPGRDVRKIAACSLALLGDVESIKGIEKALMKEKDTEVIGFMALSLALLWPLERKAMKQKVIADSGESVIANFRERVRELKVNKLIDVLRNDFKENLTINGELLFALTLMGKGDVVLFKEPVLGGPRNRPAHGMNWSGMTIEQMITKRAGHSPATAYAREAFGVSRGGRVGGFDQERQTARGMAKMAFDDPTQTGLSFRGGVHKHNRHPGSKIGF